MIVIKRTHIAITHDIIMAATSFLLTMSLRFGNSFVIDSSMLLGMVIFTAVCTCVFSAMQLYRGVWRYASVPDLIAITKSATLAILIFLPIMFMVSRLEGLPRSVLFINWVLLIMLLGAPRFIYRAIKDKKITLDFNSSAVDSRIPVLLVGVNDDSSLFIRHTSNPKNSEYRVVGVLAKKSKQVGNNVHGVRVYGTFKEVDQVIAKLKDKGKSPQKIVLALRDVDSHMVQYFLDACDRHHLTLARLPKLSELHNRQQARELKIRPICPEDLLGRSQATLNQASMRSLVHGKVVLVTGAGGTIGSEIVRQIITYQPAKILLLEISEYQLYNITQLIEKIGREVAYQPILADIRDQARLNHLFSKHQPEIIFHAAAIKHVPIAEENILETVHTNVLGTRYLADACVVFNAKAMVMISTDKAVNPSSVMGLSKRVAEIYCQSLGHSEHNKRTLFTTVRFGNVLGSSGSVVPLFQQQLEQGGPITVTHPDMVRYFMTVKEAVSLVIQSAALDKQSGDSHSIYVLDMGKPVKIVDLAHQMIKMAGLHVGQDIQITFTGLRPGEKLYEELFYQNEKLQKTMIDSIMLASPSLINYKHIHQDIMKMEKMLLQQQESELLKSLAQIVPQYQEGEQGNAVSQPAEQTWCESA